MSLIAVLVGMSMAMALFAALGDYLQRRNLPLLLIMSVVALLGLLATIQPFDLVLVFAFILYLLTLQLRLNGSQFWLLSYLLFSVLLMMGLWLATCFKIITPNITWLLLMLLSVMMVMVLIGRQQWRNVIDWLLAVIIAATILLLPRFSESLLLLIVTVSAQFIATTIILWSLTKNNQQSQPDLRTVNAIQADERSRIYRNIHDDVGADLLRLIYCLENSEQQQQVKQIMHRLRQAVAQTTQVETNLKHLVNELTSQSKSLLQAAGISYQCEVRLEVDRIFTNTHPTVIVRIMNELITNVCKHAEAKQVTLSIESHETALTIQVNDDGCGIMPGDIKSGGRGLRSLQQRADSIGADISWKSGDNGGTETHLKYPWT